MLLEVNLGEAGEEEKPGSRVPVGRLGRALVGSAPPAMSRQ